MAASRLAGMASYMPASILSYLVDLTATAGVMADLQPPLAQTYTSSVLFADVSGFTALCEQMALKKGGDELLAKGLNSYFELLLKCMSSHGGDVFKFAGDAVFVLWPPSGEDLKTVTQRAAQCALEIMDALQDVRVGGEDGVNLTVKVGVGAGQVSILHVGGNLGRMEYLPAGPAIVQAFEAEQRASSREGVLSPDAWELVREHFSADVDANGFAKLKRCKTPLTKLSLSRTVRRHLKRITHIETVYSLIKRYVPMAVLPFISSLGEKWASELRRVTVLFVNLGLGSRSQLADFASQAQLQRVQRVLMGLQNAVYMYQGSLNKFLMDDKGSTVIVVFGLPPLAHEDDAVRGVLASLEICARLHETGIVPSIGVSTGVVFCGVVGSRGRREYSVLGDHVNLAARLMQHATKIGGGVLCDAVTQYAARHRLVFAKYGRIAVKGKKSLVKIYHPYPHKLSSVFQGRAKSRRFRASTRAIDALVQETRGRRFSSVLSLFDSVSREARSESEALAGEEKEVHRVGDPPIPGGGRRKKEASIVPPLLLVSPPKNLMRDIHRFQLDGYTKQHFLKVQKRRKGFQRPRGSAKDMVLSAVLEKQKRTSMTYSQGGELVPSPVPSPRRSVEQAVESSSPIPEAPEPPHILNAVRLMVRPEGAGATEMYMTLGCIDLHTVGDVLVAAVERCHQRNLLGEAASIENCELCIHATCPAVHLREHVHLSMIPTLYKANSLPFQPVVEWDLVPSEEQQEEEEKKEEETPAPAFLRKRTTQDVFGDRELANIRERVMDRVQCLLERGEGGTIVLEGELGLGKTQLLSTTVCQAPGRILLLCAAGNPFATEKPLSVWRDIVMQLVDHERKENAPLEIARLESIEESQSEDSEEEDNEWLTADEERKQREQIVADKLRLRPSLPLLSEPSSVTSDTSVPLHGLDVLAPLLNDVLNFQFPETVAAQSVGETNRVQHAAALLLNLLQLFAERQPILCVIDDAINMDKMSWQLALHVSQRVPNLLLVLATRPVKLLNMPAFARSITEEYQALVNEEDTLTIHLKPLRDEIIFQMACDELEVDSFPPGLSALIVERSRGNPLVVKELVYALRQNALISVDPSSRQVLLAPQLAGLSLQQLVTTVDVPVPSTLQAALGSQLDRLNHQQSMLLKVAAVVGEDFRPDVLFKAYPLSNTVEELETHLCNLCSLGILGEVEGEEPRTLTFEVGFMREMVLSRMLEDQRSRLRVQVSKIQAQEMRRRSQVLLTTAVDMSKVNFDFEVLFALMYGGLQLQKGKHTGWLALRQLYANQGRRKSRARIRQDWKPHYFILSGDTLSFWDSMNTGTESKKRGNSAGVIFLAGAVVEVCSKKESNRDHSLKLHVNRWVDGAVLQLEPTVFFIAAEVEDEATRWLGWLLEGVASRLPSTQKKMISLEQQTRSWAPRRSQVENAKKQLTLPPLVQSMVKQKLLFSVIRSENSHKHAGVLTASVLVRKHHGFTLFKEWKRRWLTLTRDSIYVRVQERPVWQKHPLPLELSVEGLASTKVRNVKTSFTDLLCLSTGNCTCEMVHNQAANTGHLQPPDSCRAVGGSAVLRVSCELWMKRLVPSWETKTFVFTFDSFEIANRWMTVINKVCARVSLEGDAVQVIEEHRKNLEELLGSKTALEELERSMRSRSPDRPLELDLREKEGKRFSMIVFDTGPHPKRLQSTPSALTHPKPQRGDVIPSPQHQHQQRSANLLSTGQDAKQRAESE